MWEFSHSISTKEVNKKQIWVIWSDISNWKQWDHDIDSSEGVFVANSLIRIKPKKGPSIKATLDMVIEQSFDVYAKLPLGTNVKFYHSLTDLSDGIKLTHGIIIKGPLTFLFKYLIGNSVKKNLVATMKNLITLAKLNTSS